MGTCIRPADARADQAREQVTAYRDADDGIDQGTARVLYAAYCGTLSATDTSTDRTIKLTAPTKRGAVTHGSGVGKRVQLAPDTAYAFDISR
jgi:hypothetical protein